VTVTNGGHHSHRPRAQHHPYKSLRPTGSPGVTKPNEGRVFRFSSLHFTLKTPVLRDPPHFPSSCLFFSACGASNTLRCVPARFPARRVPAFWTRRDAFGRVQRAATLSGASEQATRWNAFWRVQTLRSHGGAGADEGVGNIEGGAF